MRPLRSQATQSSQLPVGVDTAFYSFYAHTFAVVLFWYDWLLTISDEVQRLWNRPFTGATVIYILIRYTLLVQQAFVLLGGLPMTSNGMVRVAYSIQVVDTDYNILLSS